ncbi:ABC transporter ATP-binding protein [Desulfitobacterium chlororespirans]|uniref:Putative ABC transport system ATP-binding protein n=1 Tax=Desulfitobacterium chlororespirans DSM 11544 TaxID=1121395 RepID=A0A1M7SHP7_9FIRM|nr:ATP-binding cassette domain-containing protein [Desulfitobacterium chlororespirans]SHN57993.1 putative ABC transport system ATP-binding protein [Desulfitobacterium chlororespirans DSM 11544]
MLLSAKNIGKTYGEEVILQGISLELDAGQSLAVTGPSGSGKSTLLSLLGLMLSPTVGEIWYKNESLGKLAEDRKDRLRNQEFGFIFQSANLIGSLTVLDNVLVPAYLAKNTQMKEKAVELLQEFELGHRLDYYPSELSVGQKRRVAIARALLLDPAVVFADEPTNDLDPQLCSWVGDYLFGLPAQGCALVVVTHDLELAARADKVVAIAGSHLRLQGG